MHGLNTYDYGARQYYSILGRWDRVDRFAEKYYSVSPYAYCANNPMMFVDEHGDSIIIDKYGENLHRNGSSNNVYVQEGKSFSEIGVLGETLEVTNIINNMLSRNAKLAKKIDSIYGFYKKVKTNGIWDLKNLEKSIWKEGNGNTTFAYNNELLSSDDIGNFNFGVVAKAYGMAETLALKAAGIYQIISGTSKMDWINFNVVKRPTASPSGIYGIGIDFDIAEPYGDDPKDQMWIKKGYNY